MSRDRLRCWFCGVHDDFRHEVGQGDHHVLVCRGCGKATTLTVRDTQHGEPDDREVPAA